VGVRVGLLVDRDAVGTGAREVRDLAGRALDHQMDVDDRAGLVYVIGYRRHDQGADRDRRHEMAVHDVDVDHAGAGIDHLGDLLAQAREVGGEDRRGDPTGAKQPAHRIHTGFSIEWPQCWQRRSSSALMRTIV
jgi:hypothetical protein